MYTVGKNIKIYRKKANLTQKELAQKCGLATGTIQQYELGKREPRYKHLVTIANVLNTTPGRLLFTEDSSYNMDFYDYEGSGIDEVLKAVETYTSSTADDIIRSDLNLRKKYIEEINELYASYKDDFATNELVAVFWSLNDTGKEEALKRIKELAELKKYAKSINTSNSPDLDDIDDNLDDSDAFKR